MHEDEEATINAVTSNAERTESFIIGDIEESEIEDLRERGIPVRIMHGFNESVTAAQPPLRPFSMDFGAGGTTRGINHNAGGGIFDITKPNVFLIQLDGPLLENKREALEALNVKLLEHMPVNCYTAFLTIDQVAPVRELPYVRSVELFAKSGGSVSRSLNPAAADTGLVGSKEIRIFDIKLHREEDLAMISAWLRERNVLIAGQNKTKIRFYTFPDAPIMDEILELAEVSSVEEYVKPKIFNDVARKLMNIDSVSGNVIVQNISQKGTGQIVAVADTGIDDEHADFNGRIVGKIGLGRPGNTSDPIGHGTHVAGSILGDGTESGGKLKGVAPAAKLYFQSLLDSNNGLGGLPLNLQDLFNDAYAKGARIHNNSWGASTGSKYTFDAVEVDEFVASKKDMLIVIAAGNEGVSADPAADNPGGPLRRHSDHGFVDWLTIASPATAKNALTVGASRSDRTIGGFAGMKYGDNWPSSFPKVSPVNDDDVSGHTVSGDPESIAAFSSRGPCDDRRIKPDLVAPGTDIISVRSSTASPKHFWGSYNDHNGKYAYMGGTSMATPLVSGCAALVREYYETARGHNPSAALLKGTLINGAKRLSGADAMAKQSFYHQGFGCINMVKTIPNTALPALQLEFVDTFDTPALQFKNTGQRFRFVVKVTGGTFLRTCMSYTDAPGRGLQNNLNLIVDFQDQATGKRTKWVGNADVSSELNLPDPDNNVERVWLEGNDFKPGTYTVMLFAANLLKTPQDFALVITADSPVTITRI